MTLEINTAKALRCSVYTGIAVLIVGLILHFMNLTDNILWFGLLLLIISPLIGVMVSTVSLYIEKDMRWAFIATVLIIISAIGMFIHQ